MPEIKPFQALLYNRNINIADVIAPPYDVISSKYQDELYAKSPLNIVRLILGRENDRYSASAETLKEWRKKEILVRHTVPSLYFLSQTFSIPGGKKVERKGFIAACLLEDFGKGSVFPHEKTLSKPKEDRFKLLQSMHTMFSQIFSIYADSERRLDTYLKEGMSGTPYVEVEFEGVVNKLWTCDDNKVYLAISEFMKHQKVVVADGHHRYETALMYRNALRLSNPDHTGKEAYNFVPMFFANIHDPGLVIFPTHRILHSLRKFEQKKFLASLNELFYLDNYKNLQELNSALEKETKHAFGLILPEAPQYVLVRLKDASMVETSAQPSVITQLDVSILHINIFMNILHISEEAQLKKLNLDYVRDASDAAHAVMKGKAQAAFIMNPTRMEQVRIVAETGFTMPQKSTYFYPKLLSGLVNYSFDNA